MGKTALYRRRGSISRPSGFVFDAPSSWEFDIDGPDLAVKVNDPKPPGCAFYVGAWRTIGGAWNIGAMGTVQGVFFATAGDMENGTYEVSVAFRGPAPDYTLLSAWAAPRVFVVDV